MNTFYQKEGLYKINPPKDEIWLNGDEKTRSIEEFLKLIDSAKKEIKMVCGEFDPTIYDSIKVVNVFKRFLKNNGDLKIIFSKPSKSQKEGCNEFKESHPNLNELFSMAENKSQVNLYYANKRPIQHFTLVDSASFLIEAPHDPFTSRPSLIIYGEEKIGKELEDKFDNYVEILKGKNVCPI